MEEVLAPTETTFPPRRMKAVAKEEAVRVEGSKKTLARMRCYGRGEINDGTHKTRITVLANEFIHEGRQNRLAWQRGLSSSRRRKQLPQRSSW